MPLRLQALQQAARGEQKPARYMSFLYARTSEFKAGFRPTLIQGGSKLTLSSKWNQKHKFRFIGMPSKAGWIAS